MLRMDGPHIQHYTNIDHICHTCCLNSVLNRFDYKNHQGSQVYRLDNLADRHSQFHHSLKGTVHKDDLRTQHNMNTYRLCHRGSYNALSRSGYRNHRNIQIYMKYNVTDDHIYCYSSLVDILYKGNRRILSYTHRNHCLCHIEVLYNVLSSYVHILHQKTHHGIQYDLQCIFL